MASSPELAERIRWFIRLRWLAVAGLASAAALVASQDTPVSWESLLGLACVLGILNVVFLFLSRRPLPPVPFAWWQVVVDLTILTLALHGSGGIENPFIFFYVFHVIIASILLSVRMSYLVAGLATASFMAMALLEHFEIVSHAKLGFVEWNNLRYLSVVSAVMTSTLFLATYLASTIMEGLRRKEEEMGRVRDGLLQTEKLAAIGQLAAGVAHELNTPLASIAGYAEELAEIEKTDDEKMTRYTGVIRSQIERCKGITQSLLNFARKSEIRVQPVDVNKLLEEAIQYLRFKKRVEKIEIRSELGDVPPVQADPTQLLQVFLSVLVNAVDATEQGGEITVRSLVNGMVRVSVRDTGCGIPEENLKKVFEPFYTTKGPGLGTGLGLSLSYGIIRQLGGEIELKSEVGKGTEVVLSFSK